jgi:hypothetical protein
MTGQSNLYRNQKATFGVVVGFLSVTALAAPTPCSCDLATKTAGIALEILRAVCVLANVQVTVPAGLCENLEFLQILARIGKSLWPLLGVLAS